MSPKAEEGSWWFMSGEARAALGRGGKSSDLRGTTTQPHLQELDCSLTPTQESNPKFLGMVFKKRAQLAGHGGSCL